MERSFPELSFSLQLDFPLCYINSSLLLAHYKPVTSHKLGWVSWVDGKPPRDHLWRLKLGSVIQGSSLINTFPKFQPGGGRFHDMEGAIKLLPVSILALTAVLSYFSASPEKIIVFWLKSSPKKNRTHFKSSLHLSWDRKFLSFFLLTLASKNTAFLTLERTSRSV